MEPSNPTRNKTARRKRRREVNLEILRPKHAVFIAAAEELVRRTGSPATAEDVMTFLLEGQCDPKDLADMYCWSVLKWSLEEIDRWSDHATGRTRVKRSKPKADWELR